MLGAGSSFRRIRNRRSVMFDAFTVVVPRTGRFRETLRIVSFFVPSGRTCRPYVPGLTMIVSPDRAAA